MLPEPGRDLPASSMSRCPEIRIFATLRERLWLAGEVKKFRTSSRTWLICTALPAQRINSRSGAKYLPRNLPSSGAMSNARR